MMVSVSMITYNHASFVREAVLSILNQECSFEFELIISDDCSTDNTVEIIQSIIATHKKGYLIKMIVQNPNIGMMPNFGFVLQKAKGKYIAICEGDDYWSDVNKLQLQYDILEADNTIVLTFHNAETLIENTGEKRIFNSYSKSTYTSSDLFGQWLIPTASVLFRNCLSYPLPSFLQEGTHGDIALFLLLGEFGNFAYFDKNMSVYRINDNGVTQNGFLGIDHNNKHIQQLQNMIAYFKPKHKKGLRKRMSTYQLSNSFHYSIIGNKVESKKLLIRSIRINKSLILSHPILILRTLINNFFKKNA